VWAIERTRAAVLEPELLSSGLLAMTVTADIASETRSVAQRWLVLLFAVVQILVPLLPGIGIGQPIGERSDAVHTLITPAGWAFSIWGALYTGSIVYAVYQALPAQRDDPLLGRIGWFTAGAFFGNALWAGYTQLFALDLLSVVIIFFTLICLLNIYRVFSREPSGFTTGEQWMVVLPLSALAAWLTAASIVNVAAALTHYGVEGGAAAPTIAAAIVLLGGIIAAGAIWKGRGNPWYALAFLWALAGIYASGGQESGTVLFATIAAGLLVVVIALLQLLKHNNRRHWLQAAG
jgi:hypothetical protein